MHNEREPDLIRPTHAEDVVSHVAEDERDVR